MGGECPWRTQPGWVLLQNLTFAHGIVFGRFMRPPQPPQQPRALECRQRYTPLNNGRFAWMHSINDDVAVTHLSFGAATDASSPSTVASLPADQPLQAVTAFPELLAPPQAVIGATNVVYSQAVWLGLAHSNPPSAAAGSGAGTGSGGSGTGSVLRLVRLGELADPPPSYSGTALDRLTDPLRRRGAPTCTQPPPPSPYAIAPAATHYYSYTEGQCVTRQQRTPWQSSTDMATKLSSRIRSIPSIPPSTSNTATTRCPIGDVACLLSGAGATASTVASLTSDLSRVYGMQHVLFLSTDSRQLVVLEGVELSPNCTRQGMGSSGGGVGSGTLSGGLPSSSAGGNNVLMISVSNELSLMGSVQLMEATQNAQFVFATVSRRKWELDAMIRLTNICAELKKDPQNLFLQSYQSQCTAGGSSIQYPRLPDFLQIASVCPPGTRCPRFNAEEVASMPNGVYSTYGFDLILCPPGSFCRTGVQNPCPSGFTCPRPGMALPLRCAQDPTQATSCFASGLSQPNLAPQGTMSVAPYLPPLPAPPGLKQTTTATTTATASAATAPASRSLAPCAEGDWCGLGRSNSSSAAALLCPAGTFCSQPGVFQPVICDRNGTFPSQTLQVASCPAGSSQEFLCPGGYYCANFTGVRTKCDLGAFCPNGTLVWAACPAGSYCPNPSVNITCPRGYYCPIGSLQPSPCTTLAFCPVGSSAPTQWIADLFLIVVPLFLLLLWRYAAKPLLRRRQKDAEEAYLHRREEAVAEAEAEAEAEAVATGDCDSAMSDFEGEAKGEGEGRPLAGKAAAGTNSSDGYEMSTIHDSGAAASTAGSHATTTTVAGIAPKQFCINFEFQDLGLNIKGSGVPVLAGVTGKISSHRVTAVMGPSGAGKSTFVTTLAGKAYYGDQSGSIHINGVERSLNDFKKLTGFVPQEDIMMRNMTVRENLSLSAATRLPRDWDKQRVEDFVEACIDILGLRDIANSKIGDEKKRGISGGQRKRVNIGMEMVADPTVLFLDEPTSGLDSTSSMEVCTALRDIADAGLTVITVIHQPRYEIFTMFHDVLLLGKGGRTVYLGPSHDALAYFEGLGLVCPPRVNPPDFFMDVIAGDTPQSFKDSHPDFHPDDLFDAWNEKLKRDGNGNGNSNDGSSDGDGDGDAAAAYDTLGPSVSEYGLTLTVSDGAEAEALGREQASLLSLVALYAKRAMLQETRSKLSILFDNGLVFLSAMFLALVNLGSSWNAPPLPTQAFTGCPTQIATAARQCFTVGSDQILIRSLLINLVMGLTAVMSTIRVFGDERVVYWREASGLQQPWHTIAYFLGKDLVKLPQAFIGPMVFTLLFHSVSSPRTPFMAFYVEVLGIYYASMAFGYFVSIVVPAAMSQLVGVVFVFSLVITGGGIPTLAVLQSAGPPVTYVVALNIYRYGMESIYVGEALQWEGVYDLMGFSMADYMKTTYGYYLNQYSIDVFTCFLFGVILRALCILAMVLKDSKKKL